MTSPYYIDPGPSSNSPARVREEANPVDAANIDPGIRPNWEFPIDIGLAGTSAERRDGRTDSLAAQANGRASSRLSGEVVEQGREIGASAPADAMEHLSQELNSLAAGFSPGDAGPSAGRKRPAPQDEEEERPHSTARTPAPIPLVLREWARERDLPNGLKNEQVEVEIQSEFRTVHPLCTVGPIEDGRFGRPLAVSPSGRVGFFAGEGSVIVLDNYYGTYRSYAMLPSVRLCGIVAKTDWTGVAVVSVEIDYDCVDIFLCKFLLADEWNQAAQNGEDVERRPSFELRRAERLQGWTAVTAAFRQSGNVMVVIGSRLKVRLTLALFDIDTFAQREPLEGMTGPPEMATVNWAGTLLYYVTGDGFSGTLCLESEVSFDDEMWTDQEYTIVRKPADTSAVLRDRNNILWLVRFNKPFRRYELVEMADLGTEEFGAIWSFEFETGAIVYTMSPNHRKLKVSFVDLLKRRVRPLPLGTIAFLCAHAADRDMGTAQIGPLFCDAERDAYHFHRAEQFAFLLALKRRSYDDADDLIEKMLNFGNFEEGDDCPDQPGPSKRRRRN